MSSPTIADAIWCPTCRKANYSVWVRGYGLVDSPKTQAPRARTLNLKAVPASSPAAAAQYYPAAHWLSLMEMPAKSEFPGTGDSGNGISPNMKSQGDWIRSVKSGGCTACHALGTKATREIPPALGPFPDTVAAWDRRVKSGQAGAQMSGALNQFGRARVLKMFADWTDRIRAGAIPPAPQRPQGIERNVVITQWDWADPKAYLHDVVSTDRRNPRVNANGPVYGALELSADYTPVLNPKTHTASRVPLTVRDPNTPPTSPAMPEPSPYWGDEAIWTSKNNVHNPMLDHKGRVWLTSAVRPSANPAECKEGSSHPSAKLFPVATAGRHLAVYDPATKKLTHIGTCFGTHHLMFAEDANHTLWTSGGGQVIGWLNTKMFDETQRRDEVAGLDGAHPRRQRQWQARRLCRTEPAARPHQGRAHQRYRLEAVVDDVVERSERYGMRVWIASVRPSHHFQQQRHIVHGPCHGPHDAREREWAAAGREVSRRRYAPGRRLQTADTREMRGHADRSAAVAAEPACRQSSGNRR